jgi:hypothetical protein
VSEQQANLDRVSARIRPAVKEFCLSRIGQQFHVEELTSYVRAKTTVAPGSPDRILRDLRQQGEIDYEVVSRSKSLYRVLCKEEQMVLL